MPQNANPATPEIIGDIQREYKAEYLKKVRGGKAMTGRETLLVTAFGLSMFAMVGVSMIPAVPLIGLIGLSAAAFASLAGVISEPNRLERQANALIRQDIENGTLLTRYENKLSETLGSKLGALKKLKAMFNPAGSAAAEQQNDAPAQTNTAPKNSAAANTPR